MVVLDVCVVGYGFSAQTFHFPILNSLSGLFSISSVLSSKNISIDLPQSPDLNLPQSPSSNQHENLPVKKLIVVRTLKEAIEKKPDLIVITAPNSLHAQYAIEAIKEGISVVVEKPFVVSLSEAHSVVSESQKHNVLCSVYHNRRFDSDFLYLSNAIQKGEIGAVHSFEGKFNRFRPIVKQRWREENIPGSGLLYDLGSHLIDQAVVLFGLPDSVYCQLVAQRNGAMTDDNFYLVMTYGEIKEKDTAVRKYRDPKHLRVVLEAGSLVVNSDVRYVIHGSHGSIIKTGMDVQEDQLKAGMSPVSHPSQFGRENPSHYPWVRKVDPASGEITELRPETPVGDYCEFYRQIHRAIIEKNIELAPSSAQTAGVDVTRVIEAALLSHRSKRVVQLEEIV